MTRLLHRIRRGHYPDIRQFGLESGSVTVCHTCLLVAYRDDARRIGGGGF